MAWTAAAIALALCSAAAAGSVLLLPKAALSPAEVAVVVNDLDPLSVKIGAYYRRRRGIPERNVVHVSFTPDRDVMPEGEFRRIAATLKHRTPARVQAYALTWRRPYRVECMSVTAAFALGFNRDYCAGGCRKTARSPYFDSDSTAPFSDYGLRPAMSIAADNLTDAKALIDRGIAADGTRPGGTGYLVVTGDKARDVRAARYPAVLRSFGDAIELRMLETPYIENRPDVLFYFTGAARVPSIASNTYLPGAVADHLTSFGGLPVGGGQMSSLRWLQVGATASYGTVVEPCNYPGKFPDPWVMIDHYLQGETVLEAYWKSVAMPGQGLFIGEPLARPFAGYSVQREHGRYLLSTYALRPGRYAVLGADEPVGPYVRVRSDVTVGVGEQHIAFPATGRAVYALVGRNEHGGGRIEVGSVRIDLDGAADARSQSSMASRATGENTP